MPGDKQMARIEEIEDLFRTRYSTFERKRSIETAKDASDFLSVLERARVFLVYPNDPFCQDPALKRHVREQLVEFYDFKK